MFDVINTRPSARCFWTSCAGLLAQNLCFGGALIASILWPQPMPNGAWPAMLLVGPICVLRPPPGIAPEGRKGPPRYRGAGLISAEGGYTLLTSAPSLPAFESSLEISDPVSFARMSGPIAGGAPLQLPILSLSVPLPPRPRTIPDRVPLRISRLELPIPLRRVDPVYPPLAIAARIQGPVRLLAVLGSDGRIHNVRVLSGNRVLVAAALSAVAQWTYAPPLLNGQPVEVEAPIQVDFDLKR